MNQTQTIVADEEQVAEDSYLRALLDVADIRAISVEVDGLKVDANVEVEPRDIHTQSHAGIICSRKGQKCRAREAIAKRSAAL
jgi:hypothetical protein